LGLGARTPSRLFGQCWDFPATARNDRVVKKLAQVLQTDAIAHKLSVGREAKLELPGKIDQRRDHELLRS
jgi:hypothetical protein